MGYLKNTRLYLSGPIELADTTDWRSGPKDILTRHFGINLFDPYSDPKQQWAEVLREAKENRDYTKVAEIAKSFVRKDLCMVDRADFIIAYLPYKVPTVGTHHEIINAVNAKKPVLLVTDGDIRQISSWYYGFIPWQCMFASFDELYEYLEFVDRGLCKENSRWAYVYGLV